MKKVITLSLITSSILLGNIVDVRFFYQDYFDFAQNRGKFQAGTRGVLIRERNSHTYGDYSKKGMYYDVTMPDLIGSSTKDAYYTAMGGSYVASAEHVFAELARKHFFSPEYNYNYITRKTVGVDRAYARYDKFITGATPGNLLEVTPDKPLDLNRYTHFWRAGKGAMHYVENDNVYPIGAQRLSSHTGGIVKFVGFEPDGRLIFDRTDVYFSNGPTVGDSGSAMFAWDSYEQKWYIIGFASSGSLRTSNYTPHVWSTFEGFVRENTHPIVKLNSMNATWDGSNIQLDNQNHQSFIATANKDIILNGGGTIDIGTTNINQGNGGIYFDAHKEYTFKGSGSWKGAGLHIEEGSIVHWGINGVSGDGLHKVGKGTLHVTRSNSGWLNLGEGTVILDTDSNAFEHYVLVSGRATLKLAEGRDKTLTNTDKLNFSRRGGILDLNGNNISFKKIQASDIGARIINSSQTKSTLTITNANTDSYLYHGQIGDNIDIISDAVSSNNVLAFDGEIYNPKGTLTHKQGGLLFQGHPYIHAYCDTSNEVQRVVRELVRLNLGQDLYTAPTKLDQQDWENRVYILKKISTESGTLTLGRNAFLFADLSLSNTQAKFGGNAHVFIDRYDGEGANWHSGFKQQLTSGESQKDDSFYYEGNLSLAQASTLEVSNTQNNPLRFGSFLGIDKETLGLSNKNVHYILSLDNTSNAKIKFLELHNQESIKGIQTQNPSFQTHSHSKTLSVENLKVFMGKSVISGDIILSMESYNPTDANPVAPKLIFSNLQSQIQLKDLATLSLSSSTLLQIQASNLVWENLEYNTLYPLIISEQTINDNRTQKEIEFIEKPLPSFIKPKTASTPNSIGIIFSRNITLEVMREKNWLEKYASIIISSDTNSATIEEIKNFHHAIDGFQDLLSALLETNLKGEKVFQDIYIDSLIQQACNGQTEPLKRYLGTIQTTLKSSSRYGVSILTTSMYNSSHYNYLKNIQSVMKNQIAFANPISLEKKIRLASKEVSTLNVEARSDYLTPPVFSHQNNTKNNRLWADVHGAFIGGEETLFYSTGLSGGYDYAPITESNEFLSFGASIHYSFANYKEDFAQDTSHNIIGGLHTQYIFYSNEMLLNLYAGGSIAASTNLSSPFGFNAIRANNYIMQAEAYYKFRFDLKKDENFYHALKPLLGIGYSYLYIPEEKIDNLVSISKVQSNNIFFKAGLEYNFATPKSHNILTLSATYNTTPKYAREITIGTATPIDYSTEIKPLWIEFAYSGSYLLSDDFSLNYTLATQYIPNSRYGISGNLGGAWSF